VGPADTDTELPSPTELLPACTVTLPADPLRPSPLRKDTEPPVEPTPPVSDTPPPDADPLAQLPPDTDTSSLSCTRDDPSADAPRPPVDSSTSPTEPDTLEPEPMRTEPLLPASAAAALPTWTSPLDRLELEPL
jgi:hypothetical protein